MARCLGSVRSLSAITSNSRARSIMERNTSRPMRPKFFFGCIIMADAIRVAVTGAAGQVAYAMLGRLASGEVFGPGRKVILQLLEITPAMPNLEGVAMELDDC